MPLGVPITAAIVRPAVYNSLPLMPETLPILPSPVDIAAVEEDLVEEFRVALGKLQKQLLADLESCLTIL